MENSLRQIAGQFKILAEDIEEAHHAYRARAPLVEEEPGILGTSRSILQPFAIQQQTLVEVFQSWGWRAGINERGDIVDLQFEGEKPGDVIWLFRSIAPYVQAGSFIRFAGARGETFKWTFNGTFVEAGQMGRVEYEHRVLVWLQQHVLRRDPNIGIGEKRIRVKEVRLEPGKLETLIIILFQELKRPDCLFGYQASAISPAEPSLMLGPDGEWSEGELPEDHALIISVNLREQIEAVGYGLPEECDPHGIVWIPTQETIRKNKERYEAWVTQMGQSGE